MKKQTKRNPRSRRKRRGLQNKVAMISITFVVCILFAVLLVEGASLREKVAANEEKKAALTAEITKEENRTEEIDEMKEYMKTDEYAEEAARDKLGLVKDNEIVFKEE